MRRIFLTLFVQLLLISSHHAQVFTGADAGKKIAGAELLRFTNGQRLPSYIRLNNQVQIAEKEGLDFLRKHLRLAENVQFELLEKSTDELGFTHYRYQQTVGGIPVFGGIYIMHCRDGQVVSCNGALFDEPTTLDSQTHLTADEAIRMAMNYLPAETYAWEIASPVDGKAMADYPEPQLVWVPRHLDYKAPELRLAYRLDVYALQPLQRSWLYVDAKTGIVIAEEDRICHVDEEGTALTSLSGERPIVADRVADNQYRLRESGRGNGIMTLNMQQGTLYEEAVDFEDDDNYWNNVNEFLDETATDAHWGAERFFDYLQERHNRESFDGAGAPLISYIHFGFNFGNAFWDGTASTFGDGDPDGSLNLPVVSLDIVAHEFTHGLTEYSAGLIYLDESGALNESFSDIFGAATDFFSRPQQADWLIGEEATVGGIGIRSFSDPNVHEHPDTYLGDFYQVGGGDNGGVHTNSGVMNHWFFLLSEGGTGTNDNSDDFAVAAIGWEKAMQIAYRNLTVYLTPSSSYEDAAFYANTAAIDLFGACSTEFIETNNAWYAVGLGTEAQQVTQASFSAQQLHCSLPADVQFFNTSSWSVDAFWDFGDGQTSTSYNPLHEYSQPGTYNITLITTGCDGDLDTLMRSSYIVVDTTQTYCDTIQMQFVGEETINSCSGVILDPGGLGNYMDGSYTILTIAPPNSGPLQLDFIEFETESCCDRLNIYNGPNVNAAQIASFQGTEGQGQTLVIPSGVATLEFLSDGSVTFPGFVINYSTTGGLSTPEAAFTVDNLNPPILFPVQFTDISDPSGNVEWDFGDGQISLQRNPIHQYTGPGTYSVRQVIENCYGRDTSFQQVVVQENGSISWSPDSICVTLFSGESLDTSAQISNGGPGDLYYHLVGPQASISAHSDIEYQSSGATTIHTFNDLSSTLQELTITVTLSGDYDDIVEFAELYIEGELIEEIEDENPPNGIEIVKVYTFDEATIAPWLQDGTLEVSIVNSSAVDIGFGGEDLHQVQIDGIGAGWLSLENEEGILSSGESTTIPIHLDAEGLLEGTYETTLPLINGDLNQPDVSIPIKLIVIGIPEIAVTPDTIDFGTLFLGDSALDSMLLKNPGTGPLGVSAISSVDPAFTPGTTDTILAPLDSAFIHLNFTPPTVGSYTSEILYESNAGNVSVVAIGECVYPPEITVQPDSICVTLLAGATTSEVVTILNGGLGNLQYEILVDDGFAEMLVSLYGVDVNEEYANMINGLDQHYTDYSLETITTTEADELAAALEGKELLLLPETESGAGFVFEAYDPVIQDFVSAGGGVIYCFGATTGPLAYSSIFDVNGSTALNGNELEIYDPMHPLAEGLMPPVFGLNATEGITVNDEDAAAIVGDPFSSFSTLITRNFGSGKAVYIGYDYFLTDDNANRTLANAVQYAVGGQLPNWLQIEPLSGDVDPGSEQQLTLNFDATGLLAGTYEFKMIIRSNDPEHPEVLIPVKMIVEAFPQTDFSVNATFSCTGIIEFQDETLNNPTSWLWNFGDGQTSAEANPTHTYLSNGTYDVSLITCNDLGCDTLVRENYILVDLAGNFCDTVIMNTSGMTVHTSCTGVLFDNGGPDGNYTDGVNVTAVISPPSATEIALHFDEFQLEGCCDYVRIYDGPDTDAPLIGAYNGISLAGETVTTTSGSVTINFSTDGSVTYSGFAMRWECNGQPPQATFSASMVGDCGNQVAFANMSANGTSYLWDFGDGSTSEEVAPQHFFGGTGDFTVSLTTINDFGEDTYSQTITIDEIPFNLAVNAPDTVLANTVVNFNYSASIPVGLEWELGPYGTTQSPTPSFIFLFPGEYDIYLLATAADGCQMLIHHPLTVLVNTANEEVDESIMVNVFPNPTSGQINLEVQSDQVSQMQLEWYNTLGQKLQSEPLPNGQLIQKTVDISHFPKGIYWLVLKDNNGWQTRRQVVVQ